MPKTTKRAATRRAAAIARQHATPLSSNVAVKDPPRRPVPGRKTSPRGIARYPWASIILFLLIIGGIFLVLHTYHLPPFAPAPTPKTNTKTTIGAKATPRPQVTPTVDDAASPCVKSSVVSQITRSGAPTAADVSKTNHTYSSAKNVIDDSKTYCAGINTNIGLIVIELDPKDAPKTVNNFVFLAQNHFYDGLKFHRVLNTAGSLMIAQTGDPTGNGSGGPGYKFNDEPVKGNYTAGTVAMANSGPNTNGSQFFIDTGDNSKLLQKSYNLFGHVVEGLNVAQKIQGPSDTNKNITPDVMNYVIVVPAS
jgi:cyclophilin family peptidyl-prolyl cis-trans isomerase